MMICIRSFIDSGVFELLCCPDGTKASRAATEVSFSPEMDLRCPFVRPVVSEIPPGVFRERPYQLLVSGILANGVLVVVLF